MGNRNMSNNYDNWERLMGVVLQREQDQEVALADLRKLSFRSISSSSIFGPDSSFHEQHPELEAYDSNAVNLLGDKMGLLSVFEFWGVLGLERQRGEEMAPKGKGIQPAFLDDIISRLLRSWHTSTMH
ncbi:Hypothetical predicted protein [Olea europaea subsp. europaea]|uniref:Uncharacterized protein n=1 Tax=Olea europaea subsp. europaea TaxID=158383 RepID=A0A8S0V5J5_OLEEU|nr:Hypothetical predicted protein [Olea europaea subsp. europaea]